ncbi:Strictosidine synthase [Quillaja saponaria]|uniref:Strictosidine synthase n=1 Tax=Quillaja saponaria TaxID=32244 RepID=A0AAD7QE54_QUISA|nr:Strictosidine synthase [Quillaja saponaria]
MALRKAFLCFLLAGFLAFTIQIFFSSPISLDTLELPTASPFLLPINNQLQKVIKLGEGLLKDPDDVCVDEEGTLIQQLGMVGLEGGLIVCDSEKGLLKVGEDGVTVLVSHVNGSKLRFADDVIEASDGGLYFSVASTKFELHNWYLDVLEAKPHGQLIKYDPSSNETSVVLDKLAFANGVALSKEEDYLVICETWTYRCLKYWLNRVKKGETEIFIENLPGAPDNINLAPDGSFWIALFQLTSDGRFVHTSKVFKHLVASSPRLIKLMNGVYRKAMVVNVAADGKIIRKFDDPNGKVITL